MVSEVLRFYGLRENPFRLDIDLNTFVDYEVERTTILNAVENGEKIVLLIGPTGAGKTTLLLWMRYRIKNSIYFPKPPSSFRTLQKNIYNTLPFFERLKHSSSKDIFSILNSKKFVILIDEATFISDDLLEWIKVLADQTKSTFVLAGLPELEERILSKHRTLYERIITKVKLEKLSYESARELILRRLSKYGANDLFTEEALELLYTSSGGFPRNVLRLAYECMLKGYSLRKSKIDVEVIQHVIKSKVLVKETIPIPEKQREVIEYILKNGARTSREIYRYLKNRYPEVSYHSVSVLLKRMVDNGYLIREKSGNVFVYEVSSMIKNLLIRESF